MTNPEKDQVDAFEKAVTSGEAFVEKLERSRQIILGHQGFVSGLQNEIQLIRDAVARCEPLKLQNEGADLKARYQRPLLAEAERIETIKQQADKILQEVDTPAKIRRLNDDRFEALSRRIGTLLLEEQLRRFETLRVQGPKVLGIQKKLAQSSLFRGSLAEAYVLLAELVAQSQLDSHSNLNGVEAWIAEDHSIWLYHHSGREKWKCLFFRLEINRIAEDLELLLEAYVPFGVAGDPANYELETSDAYIRPGWNLTETLTKSLNQSRSYNLNVSNSTAFGHTIGSSITATKGLTDTKGMSQTISDTDGTNISQTRSIAGTQGTTLSEGKSVSHSESWFDNWSESTGNSMNWSSGMQGNGFGGGNSFSAGRGGGQSYGKSITDSQNRADTVSTTDTNSTTHGDSKSRTDAKGINMSVATNESVAEGTQLSKNATMTTTSGEGITVGNGESIQIGFKAYGIALGKSVAQHLEKWKEANADASRVFDRVVSALDTWGNRIEENLRTMSRGLSHANLGDLKQRLPEIARYLPFESTELANVLTHQPGGPAESITEVLRPEARHGQPGLDHLAEEQVVAPQALPAEATPSFPIAPANPKSIVPPKL